MDASTDHSLSGHSSTGHGSTGHGSTGPSSTGHRSTGHRSTGDEDVAPAPPADRRGLTDVLHAVGHLLLAAAYVGVVFVLVPARSPWIRAGAVLAGAVALVTAVGLLRGGPTGRRWAWIGALLELAFCALVIALLIASAAYLHGIYGGIGEAGVAIALVAAALAVELLGLLPALTLAHLRRQAGPLRISAARAGRR
jgi:hypothetical protein